MGRRLIVIVTGAGCAKLPGAMFRGVAPLLPRSVNIEVATKARRSLNFNDLKTPILTSGSFFIYGKHIFVRLAKGEVSQRLIKKADTAKNNYNIVAVLDRL